VKVTVATAAAVVLAGGSGARMGVGCNKVHLLVAGRPVLAWSLATFTAMPEIGPIVLVVRPQDRSVTERLLGADPGLAGVRTVEGGATRQESELCGLRALAADFDAGAVEVVLVHDGARPLVTEALARKVLEAARAHGAAVPALACPDVALIAGPGDGGDERLAAPAPPGLVTVQTPQGFHGSTALAACAAALAHGFVGTDTAACVERFGAVAARGVPGDQRNIKITYPHDARLAEALLRGSRPVPG